MNLGFKEEVWIGDMYLGVMGILMTVKARRPKEMPKRLNVNREERKPWSLTKMSTQGHEKRPSKRTEEQQVA